MVCCTEPRKKGSNCLKLLFFKSSPEDRFTDFREREWGEKGKKIERETLIGCLPYEP